MNLEKALAACGLGLVTGFATGRMRVNDMAENIVRPTPVVNILHASLLPVLFGVAIGMTDKIVRAKEYLRDGIENSGSFDAETAVYAGLSTAIGMALGAASKRKTIPLEEEGMLYNMVVDANMPIPLDMNYDEHREFFHGRLKYFAKAYPSLKTFSRLGEIRKLFEKQEENFPIIEQFYEDTRPGMMYGNSLTPTNAYVIIGDSLHIVDLDESNRNLFFSDDLASVRSEALLQGQKADWDGSLEMLYLYARQKDFVLRK